jgi:hypothetical protein
MAAVPYQPKIGVRTEKPPSKEPEMNTHPDILAELVRQRQNDLRNEAASRSQSRRRRSRHVR